MHTIIERVLDEISFTATDRAGEKITVDGKYIKDNIGELVKDTDLIKVYFIVFKKYIKISF